MSIDVGLLIVTAPYSQPRADTAPAATSNAATAVTMLFMALIPVVWLFFARLTPLERSAFPPVTPPRIFSSTASARAHDGPCSAAGRTPEWRHGDPLLLPVLRPPAGHR